MKHTTKHMPVGDSNCIRGATLELTSEPPKQLETCYLADYFVVNMTADNLREVARKWLAMDNLVRVHAYEDDNGKYALVRDDRIPKKYYLKTLNFGQEKTPTEETLANMHKHASKEGCIIC